MMPLISTQKLKKDISKMAHTAAFNLLRDDKIKLKVTDDLEALWDECLRAYEEMG